MPRAFISYSRKDTPVVRRLHDALVAQALETWVDWEGIPPADDWLRKIHAAIESADSVVFVLSPDSLSSEVCAGELAHALAHRKRLVPVVARDAAEGDAQVPDALRRLNWIFLRADDDFDQGVRRLVDAVRTDLDWVQAHTRLLGRAIEWEHSRRDDSFVLQKADLAAAESWLARGPDKDPQPTSLQSEYILASRAVATVRQRRLTAAAVVAAVLVGIGALVATVQYVRAEIRREQGLSQQLAAQSQALLADDPALGLLLAVHALDFAPTTEAAGALLEALERVRGVRAFLEGAFEPGMATLSADGRLLALARCTAVDGSDRCTRAAAELWRAAPGALLRLAGTSPIDPATWQLALARDGNSLATAVLATEGAASSPARTVLYRIQGDGAGADGLTLAKVTERVVQAGSEFDAAQVFAESAPAALPAPPGPARGLDSTASDRRRLAESVRRAAGQVRGNEAAVMTAAGPGAARALSTLALGELADPVRLQLWRAQGGTMHLRTQATMSSHVWGRTLLRDDGKVAAAFGCALAASGRICDEAQLVILDDSGEQPRTTTIALHKPDWVRDIALLPAGAPWVLSGGCGQYAYQNCRQGELRLWDAEQDGTVWQAYEPLPVFGGAAESLALSADGRTMLLVTQRGHASLWSLDGLGAYRNGWLASPLGRAVNDDSLRLPPPLSCKGWPPIFEPALLSLAARLATPQALCSALAAPGVDRAEAAGDHLALAACVRRQGDRCEAGRVSVWRVAEGRLVGVRSFDTSAPVTALALAPGGARLAVAQCASADAQQCADAKLELVELNGVTGQDAPGRPMAQGGHPVISLAFSADGRLLAAGGCSRLEDTGAVRACALGEIRVWRTHPLPAAGAVAAPVHAMSAHGGEVSALAFSPDGRWLASAGGEDSLAWWSVDQGVRIGPVIGGVAGVASGLHFAAPDTLVSWAPLLQGPGAASGPPDPSGGRGPSRSAAQQDALPRPRAWLASPAGWAEQACAIANRRLSEAEAKRFMPGEPARDACAAGRLPRGSALWRWLNAALA